MKRQPAPPRPCLLQLTRWSLGKTRLLGLIATEIEAGSILFSTVKPVKKLTLYIEQFYIMGEFPHHAACSQIGFRFLRD